MFEYENDENDNDNTPDQPGTGGLFDDPEFREYLALMRESDEGERTGLIPYTYIKGSKIPFQLLADIRTEDWARATFSFGNPWEHEPIVHPH